jgi:hypothetical protein
MTGKSIYIYINWVEFTCPWFELICHMGPTHKLHISNGDLKNEKIIIKKKRKGNVV